jgi:NAD(P) transhydrogenase subunit alpha
MMRALSWRAGIATVHSPCLEAGTPTAREHRGAARAAAIAPALIAGLAALCPHAAWASGGGDVDPFVYRFMVFVMAIFVGYYVVWSVTPALHTPLMSVTNAISSVIVVGALLAVGVSLAAEGSLLARIFGFLALTMASVNIFGGFLVTQRMLGMYKKRETKK